MEQGGIVLPTERGSVGHDLYWWRHDDAGLRTAVSIYWPGPGEFDRLLAVLRWFDATGALVAQHETWLTADRMLSLDSSAPPVELPLVEAGADSVLSVELFADVDPITSDDDRRKLCGLVDWYSTTGTIATLHSDHCVLMQPQELQLTEIVVRPWECDDLQLVFLTADEELPGRSWALSVTNVVGETRTRSVDEVWKPWRVHRVDLQALFGDLVGFANGQELSVTGRRSAHRTYARPYVVSESPVLTAYHGGDLYDWENMPWHQYVMLGEGEVNPMIVLETDELSTEVTFCNTHGQLQEDFWVGVRIYDESGEMVVHEPRFCFAARDRLASAAFAELLGDIERPFAGHAAFTFSDGGRSAYPGRLQALMAYRSTESIARIMAWSDEWNTPQRRIESRRAFGPFRSYFRVLAAPFLETWLGVTNAGNHELDSPAEFTVIVEAESGERVASHHTLAPWATAWTTVDDLVPGATHLLGEINGLLLVESESDLAMVCFTRHRVSGQWSAEHLMSAPTPTADGVIWPAGS